MIGLKSRLRRHERLSCERWGGTHPQSPLLLLGTTCQQDPFYSSSATRMCEHESYPTHQYYQLTKKSAHFTLVSAKKYHATAGIQDKG